MIGVTTVSSEILNLISILIATGAVVLSFATVLLGQRQRRQDIFLRVQEILSDVDMQRGRWLLNEGAQTGELPPPGTPDSALIYRTLRMHNTVAMYVRRGPVPGGWVLDAWHHSLRNIKDGALMYVSDESKSFRWYVAPELEALIARAERYQTSMPCCQDEPAIQSQVNSRISGAGQNATEAGLEP
jgi:hypothetical protein